MLPQIECGKCHLRWLPRIEKPKRCPRCGAKPPAIVVVGVLLPIEADQFFQKTGFDYEHILKDALIAHLETWQLEEIEGKRENIDRTLFQESIRIFEILGSPTRSISMKHLDQIIAGEYPVEKIFTKEE